MLEFDTTYLDLPDRFYTRVDPTPVSNPEVIRVNTALGEKLGFDAGWLSSDAFAEFATGNRILESSTPIATVYAGHQFGGWVPRLGDGRAHLLGEVVTEDGTRFDIQLKGSGRTPYSRRGDGRSPLGPVLREYIVSEAMAALQIPTTRALAATTTGEEVFRETRLPGAVLIRVARSHIRIGTFQYFAAQDDVEALEHLVDYALARHYPERVGESGPGKRALSLLEAVASRQAQLVAKWQLVGFIHGVMNTDNTLIGGETVDYGPCAFMDAYDPETVFSSIDRYGRYAYTNQPKIIQWNLLCLARALAALFNEEELAQAQSIVDELPDAFHEHYAQGMAQKLGLEEFRDDDWQLTADLLDAMHKSNADYTLTFRALANHLDPTESDLYDVPSALDPWIERWVERLGDRATAEIARSMRAMNPVFIPRNHQVEAALEDATENDDFERFHTLVDVLKNPYDIQPDHVELTRPPRPEQRVHQTFCGT